MRVHRFSRLELTTVIKRGRAIHAQCSWMKYKPNDEGTTRLAFAVSRRHVRTNVRRNLIKRHHREAARASGARMRGQDVVVFSKPAVAHLNGVQIRQDALSLWKRLATQRAKSSSA